MFKSRLRTVGGSTMVAIPPEIRMLLDLKPTTCLRISVENGRLILEPEAVARGLKARLKTTNFSIPAEEEESRWFRMKSVGAERTYTDKALASKPAASKRGKSRGKVREAR